MQSFWTLFKRPSAFLPVAMSLAALVVVGTVAVTGVPHETDEGTRAHLFQLLMAVQAPIVVFFAVTWVPRRPRPALWILLVQVVVALAALTPVFLLGL
jgi:cell division protein FtsW (lipid II flippase)